MHFPKKKKGTCQISAHGWSTCPRMLSIARQTATFDNSIRSLAWSKAPKFIGILSRRALIAVRRDSRPSCCVAQWAFELPISRTTRNIDDVTCVWTQTYIGTNVSLPQAEKKGASPSEYGLVFGIFELVVFIISPFYGQHVSDDRISDYCIRYTFKVVTLILRHKSIRYIR